MPIVWKMLIVEERTAKGLCFDCDESYIQENKCKGRLFRMDVEGDCLVEIMDQRDEADLNESVTTTEISFHAFAGTFNPRTIRMTGWLQGRPLLILINSGSTHNFIQESVMSRLGFEVQTLTEFRVFIGSGEYLVSKEVCRQMSITIQNTVITEDLFVLSMGDANIVLGIQWLEKLEAVTTNHKELTMEFHEGNKRILL